MAEFPTIETDRCTLETFTALHLTERYLSWLRDPEVVRYSEQRHRDHDLESCRTYMDSFSGSPHYFIAIVAKEADLGHIGNMNVYVDENNLVADVGILLGDKKVWGRGYGTEAWKAVCEYLLLGLELRKVTAGTSANNAGMRGIMHRTGMVDDGKRERQFMIGGQEVDVVYAALFRESFL